MFRILLPLADVVSAFNGISAMFVGFLTAVLAFVLIILGYQYMFALDDHNKASQAKRGFGYAIIGSIVIALAAGIATKYVATIGH